MAFASLYDALLYPEFAKWLIPFYTNDNRASRCIKTTLRITKRDYNRFYESSSGEKFQ